LAPVLATFPNFGRIFVQFSGHSGRKVQDHYLDHNPLHILGSALKDPLIHCCLYQSATQILY
jgi:hypothetical protein